MSAKPSADYSDLPFHLQHPGTAATVITIVIAAAFVYLVASSYHGPAGGHGTHGAAPAASGAASAAPAASGAPKH